MTRKLKLQFKSLDYLSIADKSEIDKLLKNWWSSRRLVRLESKICIDEIVCLEGAEQS